MDKWSTYPKPSGMYTDPGWIGLGMYSNLAEGDSNVFNMDVRACIHPDTSSIAKGGDRPAGVIDQFPEVEARHKILPFQKAYVQIGANMWILGGLEMVQDGVSLYARDMETVIKLYTSLIPPKDVVIASLPWVDPRFTLDRLPLVGQFVHRFSWLSKLRGVKLNDYMSVATVETAKLCDKYGAVYLDIYNPMRLLWMANVRTSGNSVTQPYWWDPVHCDTRIHHILGGLVRKAWRI